MKISQPFLVSFAAIAILAFPARSALSADGYNTAFQTCRTAIFARFSDDKSLTVKRKSFRKRGKLYNVRYLVQQDSDASGAVQRHTVTCETNRKGELKSLDVSSS